MTFHQFRQEVQYLHGIGISEMGPLLQLKTQPIYMLQQVAIPLH